MSEKWEMLHFPLKINKHKKYISITVNCFANQNTTGGTEARKDKTKSMLLKKHVEYGYRLHNYRFKKLGVPKRTKKMSKCCIFLFQDCFNLQLQLHLPQHFSHGIELIKPQR